MENDEYKAMSREEQLQQAADEWAEFYKHAEDVCDYISVRIAYKEGAAWADEHPVDVWHDASEKPRTKEWILVQFEEDEYQTLALSEGGVDTWFNDWVDEYRAIRWAYIADLLPKGGEK